MPLLTPRMLRNRRKHTESSSPLSSLSSLSGFLGALSTKFSHYVSRPADLVELARSMLFDGQYSLVMMAILLPVELLLNLFIVLRMKYTEIDWVAYMQEVEGFLNGTYSYYELKGDTGPLVYPAGFVYIYSLLYWLTDKGANIRLAQGVFVVIYMVFIVTVFVVYKKTKRVAPIAFAIMCLTSHRIHSIFLLRLFNDPVSMLFLYASVACLLYKRWNTACVLFSLAVSVKMNVLLFAPALFIILLLSHGLTRTFGYIALCAVVQLVLGLPFLIVDPLAYIHRSFELGRQFFYVWTVNWKCVSESVFLSGYFQIGLLVIHLVVLTCFMNKCLKNIGGLPGLFSNKRRVVKLSADFVIFTMFVSNFIGISFSRSLHYQFYVWYYHSVAYLLWSTKFPNSVKLCIYGCIEMCWNVYPSTFVSSAVLHLCHMTMLVGLWRALDDDATVRLGFE